VAEIPLESEREEAISKLAKLHKVPRGALKRDLARLLAEEKQAPPADTEQALAKARAAAGSLLCCPDVLDRVVRTVRDLGVAGEERAVKLLYLVQTTRHLERPVSAAVKGPSSVGKNHVAGAVLKLQPEEGFYALTAMSEKALAYSEEPLAHRHLVLFEAEGLTEGWAAYLAPVRVVDGLGVDANLDSLARAIQEGQLALTRLSAGHELVKKRFGILPIVGDDEILERASDHLSQRAAIDTLGGRVDVGEAAGGIQAPHQVVTVLDQVAVTLLAAPQGLLALLALRNIGRHRHRAHRLPLVVLEGGHGHEGKKLGPVTAHMPHLAAVVPRGLDALEERDHLPAHLLFGMQVAYAFADHLLGPVAMHLGEGRIGEEYLHVQVGRHHPFAHLLGDAAQPAQALLGLLALVESRSIQ